MTPEFRDVLTSHGAVFSGGADLSVVASFGDPAEELQAAETQAALFVVSDLIRIRLTGDDRIKFLHNFCTNDVKGMAVGDVVEAFLTDAKARILGHGYITAFEESVELWMLPGDADALAKHLQKYVIVEDVVVQIGAPVLALALAGPDALGIYAEWQNHPVPESGRCLAKESHAVISVKWNSQPLLLVSLISNSQVPADWQALNSVGAKAAGLIAFEAIRIKERFPKIGIDLSNSNMAPEAGRNETAICYTKGCYLGQEPIARLDAMGHVNRQLYAGSIEPYDEEIPEDTGKWPMVTSMAPVTAGPMPALAPLPVKLATGASAVACRSLDGRKWNFVVSQVE